YPEGHAPLVRFMTVPVFKGDAIVAVVGVANKSSDYDESDVLQLTLLMDSVWKIVDSKKNEEALRESQERHRVILQTAMDGFWFTDIQGKLLEVNDTYCQMSGYSRAELLTMSISDIDAQELPEQTATHLTQVIEQGQHRFESRHRRKDGTMFDVEISVQYRAEGIGGLVAFLRDISDRKRAEQERVKLESQLLQSQKMESVGRLAGGVAHDFNNMLGVILGYTELALEGIGPDHPLHASLNQIQKAATHSAELTSQLLAFARKQTATPQVLDLNDTVIGMFKMLQRLIGEHIQLVWRPGANLWPIRIDPAQVNQILANLCVNARDAISATGKISIETANSAFDADSCASHKDLIPGEYVRLSVSDTGIGMDREILSHLFEPFFTTKGVGKGTGLGLATVYGIVKQNGGFINVYSEPGNGSTFTMYFPRHGEKPPRKTRDAVAASEAAQGATILLVEDELTLLDLAKTILSRQGFTVLAAKTPGEALQVASCRPCVSQTPDIPGERSPCRCAPARSGNS
ncbi:MAG TPA: PAS domain S-box protein, partial [Candidatus Ozemobacteraceae bacterium]|nr:PAS domain S-box protein [Candidatus Ozemobacteraceae bacterium]